MMRALRWSALAAALAAGAALGVLLYTEAGLRWAAGHAGAALPGRLSVAEISGRLAGPLRAAGLHYEDAGVALDVRALALDWRPILLLAGRIDVTRLDIEGLEVAVAPAAAAPPATAGPTLPLPIHIASARVRALAITVGDRAPLAIDTLDFGLDGAAEHVDLTVHGAGPAGWLSAEGRIPLRATGALALATHWEARAGEHTVAGGGTVRGSLRRIETEQTLSAPLSLRLRATIDTGGEGIRWQAAATIDPFVLATLLPGARPMTLSGEVEAAGNTAALRAEARWTMDDAEFGRWHGNGTASSDGQTFDVPSFVITADGRPTRIEGSVAAPDAARAEYRLALRWRDLAWPLTGSATLSSPQGSATLSGGPGGYRYTLEGALAHPRLPPAEVRLAGHGDRTALQVTAAEGRWLEGTWSGSATLSWSGAPRWRMDLRTRGVNPGAVLPEWPGRIAAALTVTGEEGDAAPTIKAEVREFSGTLRGYPLDGAVQAERRGDEIALRDLRVHLGGAELRAGARLGARWDIDWRLHAPDLAALYPGLAGTLQTQGTVTGTPDALRIDGRLSAAAVAYADYRLERLEARAALDFAHDGRWEIAAGAEQFRVHGTPLGRIAVDGWGTPEQHTAHLAIDGGNHLDLTLRGALRDGRWQARLSDGVLGTPRVGTWTQQAAAELVVAPAEATLGPLCWASSGGRVCLDGRWRDGDAELGVEWREIRLDVLEPFLPLPDIDLTGTSQGALRLGAGDDGLREVRLSVAMSDGSVGVPMPSEGERLTLAYERATLTLEAGDARGLRAEAVLRFSDAERIEAAVRLPRWRAAAPRPAPDQPVSGSIQIALRDVSALSLFLPELQAPEGMLDVHLNLAGTWGAPQLNGAARLELPALIMARTGLRLEALLATLEVERNAWRLLAAARSGAGTIAVQGAGEVQDLAHWQGRFSIGGENVETLRLPTAQIVTSPEVTLDIRPEQLTVGGKVHIPAARIELIAPESTGVVSQDVVITGAPEAAAPSAAAARRLLGSLTLTLGDDIRLSGQGFTGRLSGQLTLIFDEQGHVGGQGELRVLDGKYRAHQQNLTITQGRLLYAGGAIDNPAIDIIATRKRGDVEVGMRVTGTAREPQLRLFSNPAMDEADILSYLILGLPLRQASGNDGRLLYQAASSLAVIGGELLADRIAGRFHLEEVRIEAGEQPTDTALVLGRQLSPRIYIRYIQGLVENTAAFQIRYQLNEKWAIETESGTRAGSGADLLYTLER